MFELLFDVNNRAFLFILLKISGLLWRMAKADGHSPLALNDFNALISG
jgi:hypothetical protein